MIGACKTLGQIARKFRSHRCGNVTIIFALTIIPVMGAVGAAVDFSQASSARAAMQASADATALMLSKLASSLSQSQLNQKATEFFQANFNRPGVSSITVTPVLTLGDKPQLTVNASGSLSTNFMGLFGFKNLKIGTEAVVKWGETRVRVALVLDNTGSMASAGKIDALKSAARNFVGQMQSTARINGDVYVSIIPFANDVNVGKSNYAASWVDYGKHSGGYDGWDASNGQCSVMGAATAKDCKGAKGVWTTADHSTWNGCVTDRDKNFDTTNKAPNVGNSKTLFPAEQEPNCPVELMPLSYDWTALKSKIDTMTPQGNTNQAIGLQWGFQSLTSAPFTIPALDANYKYKQIVILLTDGLNTQSRYTKYDPLLDTDLLKQKEVDDRTSQACANIKAASMTIYAVQVNTDGDPTSKMLQDCASSPDKFFLLTSSTSIVSTFDQIASEISMRRLAQ